jgi:hypothetical protein
MNKQHNITRLSTLALFLLISVSATFAQEGDPQILDMMRQMNQLLGAQGFSW